MQACSQTGRQAGTLPGGQVREADAEGAALEYVGGGRNAGTDAEACRTTSSSLKVVVL